LAKSIDAWAKGVRAQSISGDWRTLFQRKKMSASKNPKSVFLGYGAPYSSAGIRNRTELRENPLLGHIFETFCLGQILRYF
jgi:hypothetical protein